jgi:hypothetical protein
VNPSERADPWVALLDVLGRSVTQQAFIFAEDPHLKGTIDNPCLALLVVRHEPLGQKAGRHHYYDALRLRLSRCHFPSPVIDKHASCRPQRQG